MGGSQGPSGPERPTGLRGRKAEARKREEVAKD